VSIKKGAIRQTSGRKTNLLKERMLYQETLGDASSLQRVRKKRKEREEGEKGKKRRSKNSRSG